MSPALTGVWAWWNSVPLFWQPFVVLLGVAIFWVFGLLWLATSRHFVMRKREADIKNYAEIAVAAVRAVMEAERHAPKRFVLAADSGAFKLTGQDANLILKKPEFWKEKHK